MWVRRVGSDLQIGREPPRITDKPTIRAAHRGQFYSPVNGQPQLDPKRKTIRNNLAEFHGKELIDTWPEAGLRAEQLSIGEFAAMYARIAASEGERE